MRASSMVATWQATHHVRWGVFPQTCKLLRAVTVVACPE